MDRQAQRFLKNWAVACGALAAIVAAFNVAINPYLLFDAPRIEGFNARKPAVETQERLMKAYDVLRMKPNTLLLGTSRVDLGMDAQHSVWPADDIPVYNLGITGGRPYISYRYLQHVMSQHRVSLIMLGLDFEYFLTVDEAELPLGPEFEQRLVVKPDGSANPDWGWQHIRDVFQTTFSLTVLKDSAATLSANLAYNVNSSDLTAGNLEWNPFKRATAQVGSYPLVALSDLGTIRYWRGKKRDPSVMRDVEAIVNLCKSRGTRIVLFINPAHADELEILDLLGYWPQLEDWKREVAILAAKYSYGDSHSLIPLWDFSGYDLYSTEPVPMEPHLLHWFHDPRHYTRALGNEIIRRIFGADDVQFGFLLNPDNIEPHLATIREQQRLYRKNHPIDAQRVRDLYESVTGIQPPRLTPPSNPAAESAPPKAELPAP